MIVRQGYGRRVALVRRDTGLSRQSFARAVLSPGASAKNIGRVEDQEVVPTLHTLHKVAAACDVDFEWLVKGECPLLPFDIVKTGGIGARIRVLRTVRGLTRNALARESKLGNTTKNISRLEDGTHRPRARTVVKIAKALNVDPRFLAYGQA